MLDPFTPTFFRRLQQLKIRTRRAFLGSRQGGHRSIRKGHGLEFSDYRPYAPGDDYRHIDWGVYARTDRLYVRQFREEQDLNVMDTRRCQSFDGFSGREKKFEFAQQLALALGYIALTDGDTVTFSLGQKNTPRLIGPRALSRARKELYDAEPTGVFDMLTEVRAAVARQRIPGKCFFVSDFLFEQDVQFETLDFLRSRNFEICLIQVMAPSELTLSLEASEVIVDAESGTTLELALDRSSAREYAIALAAHIEGLEEYCSKSGIVHLLVSSDESLFDVVLTKLPQLGILK